MFPQFKKINNESGVVLFIVLMASIIIMIYSLGVLTQSMNEINYAQQQIDQITTQQWSKGMMWNAYTSNMSASSMSPPTLTVDGRMYQTTMSMAANGMMTVTTNYDTFQ